MTKKAAVMLANGFEEVEALLTVDILRRAGIQCDTIALAEQLVTASHGVKVMADKKLSDMDREERESYKLLVLPGGQPGADNLRDNATVIEWVQSFAGNPEKLLAANCAAPEVLARAGIKGRKVTSYPDPALKKLFREEDYVDDNSLLDELVMVDGNLISSRGPAGTFPFAYKLVELLGGDAERLKEAMQYNALKNSFK